MATLTALAPAAPESAPESAPAIDAPTVNAVLIAVRQAANVLCDRWSLVTLLVQVVITLRLLEYLEILEADGNRSFFPRAFWQSLLSGLAIMEIIPLRQLALVVV